MNPMIASTNVCLNCNTQYRPEDLYCGVCGWILPHALDNERTYHVPARQDGPLDLQWGTGYFHTYARLFLRVEEGDQVIQVKFSSLMAILGRQTPAEPVDIDLTPFGAAAMGVSRRHAQINRQRDNLIIADLNSSNGSYLNRERLIPGRGYPLRNRAILQLGKLVLRVQFA
jgi:hypothetical protein